MDSEEERYRVFDSRIVPKRDLVVATRVVGGDNHSCTHDVATYNDYELCVSRQIEALIKQCQSCTERSICSMALARFTKCSTI